MNKTTKIVLIVSTIAIISGTVLYFTVFKKDYKAESAALISQWGDSQATKDKMIALLDKMDKSELKDYYSWLKSITLKTEIKDEALKGRIALLNTKYKILGN